MKKAIIIITCIMLLAINSTLFYLQYCTVDAKYARDNLNYLTEQLENQGIGKKTEFSLFSQPCYKNIQDIYQLSWNWNTKYMMLENKELADNPSDTIGRLILQANDDNVQEIYTEVQYITAINGINTELSEHIMYLWIEREQQRLPQINKIINQMRIEYYISVVIILINCLIILNFRKHCRP